MFLGNNAREVTGSRVYLDVLVSGADGPEKTLDLLLVLLGLACSVSQDVLEETIFQLEAELQLLQNFAGSRLNLRQEGAS